MIPNPLQASPRVDIKRVPCSLMINNPKRGARFVKHQAKLEKDIHFPEEIQKENWMFGKAFVVFVQ